VSLVKPARENDDPLILLVSCGQVAADVTGHSKSFARSRSCTSPAPAAPQNDGNQIWGWQNGPSTQV